MINIKKFLLSNYGILFITILFILVNAYFVLHEKYYFLAVPFLLFILYLAILSLDKLLLVVVYFVPISLPLDLFLPDLGFNVQLPTEPVLLTITLFLFFKILSGQGLDHKIISHPVSLAIGFNLFWILITSIFSCLPLVSYKFLLSRIWFVFPFYFLAIEVFKNRRNIPRFLWAYNFLLIVIIGIAVGKLLQYGLFNQQIAHRAPEPFFNDHTEYGAVLAMLFPFSIALAFNNRYTFGIRVLNWFNVIVLTIAIAFSYCRGAWIGILISFIIFLIIQSRIKFKWILTSGLLFIILLFSLSDDIYDKLSHNKQDSSMEFSKHIASMSNFKTDESNVERINRWKSAFRMFYEKPVLGWGPGTYIFKYAPFQIVQEKTNISTNNGERGNAHSEYIETLAESGLFGLLSFLAIIIFTLITSAKVYKKSQPNSHTRLLVLSATLGLITYYIHALINDFLVNDKVSALFWGFTAIIVALDIYSKKNVDLYDDVQNN